MHLLKFNIAGETVQITPDHPIPSKVFNSFEPFAVNEQKELQLQNPLLTILLHEEDEKSSPDILVHSFETDTGNCQLFREGDSFTFRIHSDSALPITLKTTKGTEVVHAYTPSIYAIHKANFIFSIWMALSLAGAHRGLSMVHSSVIVYKGKAILFLGESGTGKSTHTELWVNNIEGSYRLNDDSPVVKIVKHAGNVTGSETSSDVEVLVSGSPWSGKGKIFKNEICPLAAVVRLKKAKNNKITQLNKLGAFAALYPSFPPALAADELYTEDICTIISNIIKTTPVYELEALPEKEAAFLVKESIFK
jgi:hypothetical protein